MKDSSILGTGNSRYLKSAIPAGTSWESALAMLIAGTFPIDLNGINEAGFSQVGDALSKANLLKDATAEALGLTAAAVPDEALAALLAMATRNAKDIASGVKLEVGSYAGTGSVSKTITYGFTPKIWGFLAATSEPEDDYGGTLWLSGNNLLIAPWGVLPTKSEYDEFSVNIDGLWVYPGSDTGEALEYNGNSVTIGIENKRFNEVGSTYYHFAIG